MHPHNSPKTTPMKVTKGSILLSTSITSQFQLISQQHLMQQSPPPSSKVFISWLQEQNTLLLIHHLICSFSVSLLASTLNVGALQKSSAQTSTCLHFLGGLIQTHGFTEQLLTGDSQI